ncbi:MAG: UV DNA damage repair endonuclease UvsE, partial [Methanoregula sp.]|nr:UV DNA damage repair endonuclease UvsE [Methanoregula sp.]
MNTRRIGYPCINRTIGCTPSRTFRLASYSKERLIETVGANLTCLSAILEYNVRHGILFFRITSDLVPFASHEISQFPWQEQFSTQFKTTGKFIRDHALRISMHPDQFVLLNSKKEEVLRRSIADLQYQVSVLDLLGLDDSAKVQIHVGGVYDDKSASIDRFVTQYLALDPRIRRRLVIENDERLYTVADCCAISDKTGVPVLFDAFHHSLHNNREALPALLDRVRATWHEADGIPMVDYSSQQAGKRPDRK